MDYNIYTTTNTDNNNTSIRSTHKINQNAKKQFEKKPLSLSYYHSNRVESNETLIEDYEIRLVRLNQMKTRLKSNLISLKTNKVSNKQYTEKNIKINLTQIDNEIDQYTHIINELKNRS